MRLWIISNSASRRRLASRRTARRTSLGDIPTRVIFLAPLIVASAASLIVGVRTTFRYTLVGSPAEVVAARFPEKWNQQVPPVPLPSVRTRNIDLSASLGLLNPYPTNGYSHKPALSLDRELLLRDVTSSK